MTYGEKLRDPRWQKVRLQRMERDGFRCRLCWDEKTELHVHHPYYDARDPWDYPVDDLITLCKKCHKKISPRSIIRRLDRVGTILPGRTHDSDALEALPDPVERELARRVLTEEGALVEAAGRGGAMWFHHEGLRTLLRPWLEARRAPYDDELHALAEASALVRALLSEHAKLPGRTHDVERREARMLMDRLENRRLRDCIRALDQAIRDAEREERSNRNDLVEKLVSERRILNTLLHAGIKDDA
jgi:hypothetical protein